MESGNLDAVFANINWDTVDLDDVELELDNEDDCPGTRAAYVKKEHNCAICRAEQAAYMREYQKKRRIQKRIKKKQEAVSNMRDNDPFAGKTVRFKNSRTNARWFVWAGSWPNYSLETVGSGRKIFKHVTAEQIELVEE